MATTITPPSGTVTPPPDFDSGLDSAFADSTPVTDASEALGATADEETPSEVESPEDTETLDEIVDTEDEAPADDEEEAAPEDEAPAEEDQAQPDEEVKPGEHKGKKGFFLTEGRYRTFEGAHKAVRAIEAVTNEPFTPETAQRNHAAYLGQERMYSDFLSPDAATQQKFLQHFCNEARSAVQNGDAPSDAMISLAQQMPDVLEQMHPEAHGALMTAATRRMINDLLPEARKLAEANQPALLRSLQNLELKIFGDYTRQANIKLPDPASEQQKREKSAQEQLDQLRNQTATESWQRWERTTNTGISESVRGEITQAIDGIFAKAPKALAALKKNNPDLYQSQVDRLNSKIKTEFKSNAELRRAIQVEMSHAKNATSEERRQARADAIIERHKFAAKRVISEMLPSISKELARASKGAQDAINTRRQAASNNRAPSGAGKEVRQSLVPNRNPRTGENWNPDDFAKHIDSLI